VLYPQPPRCSFCFLQVVPSYVVALAIDASYAQSTGVTSLDKIHNGSFRLYLGGLNSAYNARQERWRVNYLGFGVVDCEISAWATWTPCSSHCGGGSRSRNRFIMQHPAAGGKACPHNITYHESEPCNMDQCVGHGPSQVCGGTTISGGTPWFTKSNTNRSSSSWISYGSRGIYVDVNTAVCGFQHTPYYAVSVIGDLSFPDDWQVNFHNNG
jgi:hypothetical protein